MGGANEIFEDCPALPSLLFYGTLCLLKMMCLSLLTIKYRVTKEIFPNEEDKQYFSDKAKITLSDPDIERVRRNHLNDMENILPFLLVGLCYVFTMPSLGMALLHFRIFTLSRLMHTACYQFALPQPGRVVCFGIGFLVTFSMAIQVLFHTAL